MATDPARNAPALPRPHRSIPTAVTSQKVVAERWRAGWSLAVGAGPGSAHGVVAITNGAAVKTRGLRRGMRADDGMRDRR